MPSEEYRRSEDYFSCSFCISHTEKLSLGMITSFTIDRYRSIKHLELMGLRNINLLVGANNSGKSSVLEAVGLTMEDIKMVFMTHLREMRGITAIDIDFRTLFHALDYSDEISFLAKMDTGTRDVKVYILSSEENDEFYKINPEAPHNLPGLEILQIDYDFSKKETKSKEFLISSRNRVIYFVNTYELNYIFNNYHPPLTNFLSQVFKTKQKHKLINVLSQIDENITDISILTDTNTETYLDAGFGPLVPMSMMGDGIKNVALIAAGLLSLKDNGILLVDEIDTGLHYSALTHLWKAVLATLKERPDLQLFATTHSNECVRALDAVLKEEYGEDLENAPACLIRIERQGEAHRAVYYEPDVLDATLTMRVEYR